jgi:phospholipid transport system transporter-binding protein
VNAPRLERIDDARYRVTGALTFPYVGEFYRHSVGELGRGERLRIDLAGVSRADSAGLALLLEWLRAVRLGGGTVEFANIPAQLASLIRLSGLAEPFALPAGGGARA